MQENECTNKHLTIIQGGRVRNSSPAHLKSKLLVVLDDDDAEDTDDCAPSCSSQTINHAHQQTHQQTQVQVNGAMTNGHYEPPNGYYHQNGPIISENGHSKGSNNTSTTGTGQMQGETCCSTVYAANGTLHETNGPTINQFNNGIDQLHMPGPLYAHNSCVYEAMPSTSFEPSFYPMIDQHPEIQPPVSYSMYPPPEYPPFCLPPGYPPPVVDLVYDPIYHQPYPPPPPPFPNFYGPPPNFHPYSQPDFLQPLSLLPPLLPPLQHLSPLSSMPHLPTMPPLSSYPPYPPEMFMYPPPLPYSQMPFFSSDFPPLQESTPENAQFVFATLRTPTPDSPEHFVERTTPLAPPEDFDDQPMDGTSLASASSTPAPPPIGDDPPEHLDYYYTNGFCIEAFVKANDAAIPELQALDIPIQRIQEPSVRQTIVSKLGQTTPMTIAAAKHYEDYMSGIVTKFPEPLTSESTQRNMKERGVHNKLITKAERALNKIGRFGSEMEVLKNSATECRKQKMSVKETIAHLKRLVEFSPEVEAEIEQGMRLGIRGALRQHCESS